ncbi:MAG: DUF4296 domain-containing protein [Bacteroidales bacterium]
MKNNILFIGFVLWSVFLSNCTQSIDKRSKPPDDLLSREEMVDIIVDLELYDAIINTESKKKDNKDTVNYKKFHLYNSILEKHSITREQFNRSFEYYQNDLDFLDGIYADVITRLSKMKTDADQAKEEE